MRELDDDDEHLPFSRRIKESSIPDKFIGPIMDKYNSKGDPAYPLRDYMT